MYVSNKHNLRCHVLPALSMTCRMCQWALSALDAYTCSSHSFMLSPWPCGCSSIWPLSSTVYLLIEQPWFEPVLSLIVLEYGNGVNKTDIVLTIMGFTYSFWCHVWTNGMESHDWLVMSAVSTMSEECATDLPYQARLFSHLRRCKYGKYQVPILCPNMYGTLALRSTLGWILKAKRKGKFCR